MKTIMLMIMMVVSVGAYANQTSDGKFYFESRKSGPSRFDQSPVKFVDKVSFNAPKDYVDLKSLILDAEESPIEMTEDGTVQLVVDGRLVEVLGRATKEKHYWVLSLNESVMISEVQTGSYLRPYSTCRAYFYSNRGMDKISEFNLEIAKNDAVLVTLKYRTAKNLFNISLDIPFFCIGR